MSDLFVDNIENMSPEEKLFLAIFGDGAKTWDNRDKEARECLNKYIEDHPELLPDAIMSIDEIENEIISYMNNMRREYLKQRNKDEENSENDYAYAYSVVTFNIIRWIIGEFRKNHGEYCIFHMCDKGCEAVQELRQKLQENQNNLPSEEKKDE